jgi:hypothetical protein
LRNHQLRTLLDVQQIKERAAELRVNDLPSQIYSLLASVRDEALLVCWIAFDAPILRERLAYFKQELSQVEPLIDGNYLIKQFKLRPSPVFQTILSRLLDARLDGQVVSIEDERQLVEAFLAEQEQP